MHWQPTTQLKKSRACGGHAKNDKLVSKIIEKKCEIFRPAHELQSLQMERRRRRSAAQHNNYARRRRDIVVADRSASVFAERTASGHPTARRGSAI